VIVYVIKNIYAMKTQNFKTTVSPFAGISLIYFHFNKSGLSQLIDNVRFDILCSGVMCEVRSQFDI